MAATDLAVLALALLTAGAGVATLRSALRFRRRSVRVEGQVVGRTAYSLNRSTRAIVAFDTAEGARHEMIARTPDDTYVHEMGGRVGVRYDPADPSTARLDTLREQFTLPAILLLVTVAILAVWTANVRGWPDRGWNPTPAAATPGASADPVRDP